VLRLGEVVQSSSQWTGKHTRTDREHSLFRCKRLRVKCCEGLCKYYEFLCASAARARTVSVVCEEALTA
jgi:hypothetical protein